jgi:predicted dehydrogenase
MHARAVAAAGGIVVAVADIDVERARALDDAARAFASAAELLDSTSPDVLHVCTPVETHADTVAAALAAGVHVVVEKPVALDAATTRRLVDGARDADRCLVPVHQFLFQAGVVRLLESRGRLGRLVRCSFDAVSAGSDVTGVDPDRLLSEILPHPLSLFARVVQSPLSELTWHVIAPTRGELRALAVADGISLEIAISSNGRPTRTELELMGTRATGYADLFHGFAIVDRGRATRVTKLTRPFTHSARVLTGATANLTRRAVSRESAYPGLRELVGRTYDAIGTGAGSPISLEETVDVAAARDEILESIRAGP